MMKGTFYFILPYSQTAYNTHSIGNLLPADKLSLYQEMLCQRLGKKNHQYSSPAVIPVDTIKTSMARCALVCTSGVEAIGVSNNFLDGFKVYSARGNTCLVLQM